MSSPSSLCPALPAPKSLSLRVKIGSVLRRPPVHLPHCSPEIDTSRGVSLVMLPAWCLVPALTRVAASSSFVISVPGLRLRRQGQRCSVTLLPTQRQPRKPSGARHSRRRRCVRAGDSDGVRQLRNHFWTIGAVLWAFLFSLLALKVRRIGCAHFSAPTTPYTSPHALCDIIYLVSHAHRMLISALAI